MHQNLLCALVLVVVCIRVGQIQAVLGYRLHQGGTNTASPGVQVVSVWHKHNKYRDTDCIRVEQTQAALEYKLQQGGTNTDSPMIQIATG